MEIPNARRGIALALLVLTLVSGTAVLAQRSNRFDLSWNVIGSGGGKRAATSLMLRDTLGQPAVGMGSGASVDLGGGFWYMPQPAAVSAQYLPLVYSGEAEKPIPEGVKGHEMANLAVASIEASTRFPAPGERIDVSITVSNRGGALNGPVTLALFDGSGRIVKEILDPPLGANEARIASLSWVASQMGPLTLSTVLDPEMRYIDRDRSDNLLSVRLGVAPRPEALADFRIDELGVTEEPGQPGRLRSRVSNVGAVAAHAAVELRADGLVALVDVLGPLAPGASTAIEVPWGTEPPVGLLHGVVNPRYMAHEPNQSDNTSTVDLRPLHDLRVDGFSVAAARYEPGRARQVTVSFSVVNGGRRFVENSIRTHLFLGDFPKGEAFAEYDHFTGMLPAGEVVHVSYTLDAPMGEFDVRIHTDADEVIAESSESNNVAAWHFRNPTADAGRWVDIGPRIVDARGTNYEWENLGATGRLTSIAVHPSAPNQIIVVGPNKGVWKTNDAGKHWWPIADSLPSAAASAVAIAPSMPMRVYLAMERDLGLYRSDDGGTSWSNVSGSVNLDLPTWLGTVVVHPTNADMVYVASRAGVYRSTNGGGADWTLTLRPRLPGMGGWDTSLVMNPTDSRGVLFAGIQGDGIYKSVDGGDVWESLVHSSLPTENFTAIRLGLSRNHPNVVYAAYARPKDPTDKTKANPCPYEIYRTDDGGSTWSQQAKHCAPLEVIGVAPDNPDTVFLGGVEFYRSMDKGKTFNRVPGPHVDHHGFAAHPTDANTIYVTGDGGVYRSNSLGRQGSWEFISRGLANIDFYHGAIAVTNPSVMLGGTQDNGTLLYDSEIICPSEEALCSPWREVRAGDGATVAFDPLNHSVFYTMHQHVNEIRKNWRLGKESASFVNGLPGSGEVTVEASDQAYEPNTILAPADQNLKVNLHNVSAALLDIVFELEDMRTATIEAQPGKTASVTFATPKNAGDYTFFRSNRRTVAGTLTIGGPFCFNPHFQVHPSTPSTLLASCKSLWRTTTNTPPGAWLSILTPTRGNILRSTVDSTIDLYYAASDGEDLGRIRAGPHGANWKEVFRHPSGWSITDIEVDPIHPETVYASFGGQGPGRVFQLRRTSKAPETMTAVDITANLATGLIVKTIVVDRLVDLTVYVGTQRGVYRGQSEDDGKHWFWRAYSNGLPLPDVREIMIHPTTNIMRIATFGRGAYEVDTDLTNSRPDLIPVPVNGVAPDIRYCRRDPQGRLIVTLENQGSAYAPAFLTEVYFRMNSPSPDSRVIEPSPGMLPNEIRELPPIVIPPGCRDPDCNFDINVDVTNSVGESAEGNNKVASRCIG